MRTVSFVTVFFTTFFLCHAAPVGTGVEQQESFVVKKKKGGGKAGRKTKEQACQGFGQCATSGAELIERVAKIQGRGLERTMQYLDGDDPFSGVKKSDIQELARRSQVLGQKMNQWRQECDKHMNFVDGIFTKGTVAQTPQH